MAGKKAALIARDVPKIFTSQEALETAVIYVTDALKYKSEKAWNLRDAAHCYDAIIAVAEDKIEKEYRPEDITSFGKFIAQRPRIYANTIAGDGGTSVAGFKLSQTMKQNIVHMYTAINNKVNIAVIANYLRVENYEISLAEELVPVQVMSDATNDHIIAHYIQLFCAFLTSDDFAAVRLEDLVSKAYRFETLWPMMLTRTNMCYAYNDCGHIMDLGFIFNEDESLEVPAEDEGGAPIPKTLMEQQLLYKGERILELILKQVDNFDFSLKPKENGLPFNTTIIRNSLIAQAGTGVFRESEKRVATKDFAAASTIIKKKRKDLL